MLFFLKKPVLHIDCFVDEKHAYVAEYSPIELSTKFIPSWFKHLPPNSNDPFESICLKNAKTCPGINTFLRTGFILPMWSDLAIEWSLEHYKWQYADQISYVFQEENTLIDGFADNHYILKIISPWIISFAKPTGVLFTDPAYFSGLNQFYKTIPACLTSLSKHNVIGSHQFLFLQKNKITQKGIIRHQQPLIQFIPLGDYNYKIKCHVDSKKYNTYNSILSNRVAFSSNGIVKRLIDNKKRLCPFN